jgi:hypothetical protein
MPDNGNRWIVTISFYPPSVEDRKWSIEEMDELADHRNR